MGAVRGRPRGADAAVDLDRFATIDGVDVPRGPAYLVTDVDPGRATLNVTPDDALERIVAQGRSPLTIEEGVAVLAQDPEILRTQNSFSLLGSRCGDRRVPALWVSGGRPRLCWCWAGNPHTWLGSACAAEGSARSNAARAGCAAPPRCDAGSTR
jgi:hypothetical protein